MTRRPILKVPKLLQAVLTVGGVYVGFIVVFDVLLGQVIPSSLLDMYMFVVVAGAFMAFTFTDEGTRELVAPIRALVDDPAKRWVRNAAFVVLPLAAGFYTWHKMQPRLDAPLELRSIHPAPPSTLEAFGKTFDLATLTNPYRRLEKEDPKKFREMVSAGAAVYIQNCHFCHGDKLDGKGPYTAALNPVPANFQDIGTIAQLQESYLFWRIATGGPGLPKEAMPWLSAMPVWRNFLSEDEIWKVILFLYDYTGHRPRSFAQQ